MSGILITLFLQSLLMLPPRPAMENPASVTQVPQKLRKDYDKFWARFVAAKDDAKLLKDVDKVLKKQRGFDQALILEGYVGLYRGDDKTAREKFTQALVVSPKNRIAMYYAAELDYAHGEYARASNLYAELQSIDPSRPEVETKRQKSLLLATDSLLRSATRAESENRLTEAEDYYRQAMRIVPNEPVLHAHLADLLTKLNKKEDAAAERKLAEYLSPSPSPARPARVPAADQTARADNLEDLGRWGGDIEVFHNIREANALTREQFALLLVRYFPQVTETRQSRQIISDIQSSSARSEIQAVVDNALMTLLPNHYFEPSAAMSRGDLAAALARLSRLLRVPAGGQPSTVAAPDVSETNAIYAEVQSVLGSGLMTLDDSGTFNFNGQVPGQQALRSAERLLRIFQQAQR